MTALLEDNPVTVRDAERPRPIRIVFAGGGTGGHLYPSLAVSQALRAELPDIRFSFYATERKVDRDILSVAGESLQTQPVEPLTMQPWRWPGFWSAWRRSTKACAADFRHDRPALVVGSGAFASAPGVCTAARMGIPTVLLNPDVVPGRANWMLSRRVDCVLAQFASTRKHLPEGVRMEVVGCPVRPGFVSNDADRGSILKRHDLDANRKTLLVTGASLAARSINDAMLRLAPDLATHANWQVVHLTGRDDLERMQMGYSSRRVKAVCLDYTEDMPDLMSVADLVVSRAGASTIAELQAVGVPGILIPYPHHRDQHQTANAMELVALGTGRVCQEAQDPLATAARLRGLLLELISNDRALDSMRSTAKAQQVTDAAERASKVMFELAGIGAR